MLPGFIINFFLNLSKDSAEVSLLQEHDWHAALRATSVTEPGGICFTVLVGMRAAVALFSNSFMSHLHPGWRSLTEGTLGERGWLPAQSPGRARASCSSAWLPAPPGSFTTLRAPRDPGCSEGALGRCEEPWSCCFSSQSASFGLILTSAFQPDSTPFLPPPGQGYSCPCARGTSAFLPK